jgi:hypothetical protein
VESAHEAVGPGATFRLQETEVVIEAFPDETIAVNLANGRYYSINLVGAEALELLVAGHPLEVVVARVAVRYEVDPARVDIAVAEFVAKLLAEGLLIPAPGERPSGVLPPPVRSAVAFTDPTFSVYSDMEDLLLLDPIHDVDETGWPVRAEAGDPDPSGPRGPE